VNGGFTFVFGTLTLEGPAAGPATINVASHNSLSSSDFASSAPIALRANTTINTVSAQSSLTVAGPITGPITGPGVVLTKAGPGTLTLTGVSSVSSYAQTNVMAGTLNIRAGANVSDNIGTVGATINGPGWHGERYWPLDVDEQPTNCRCFRHRHLEHYEWRPGDRLPRANRPLRDRLPVRLRTRGHPS
jgi:autotransporter-associated beta strand protein